MPRRSLPRLLKDEFTGYSASKFRQDLLAGLTVAAVALPLALAFGVASGATAAAGLVTAILAGFVIGGLSGAPYQISGPTGAMSAVLLVLAQRYGLPGVWVAGALAGGLLLVISGFTSGIALIIFIGQIDNFLGVRTPGAESAALKLAGYLRGGFAPNWQAVGLGLLVVGTMALWPRRWAARFPASLLGIILATAAAAVLGWQVDAIGAIPRTLLLEDRLSLSAVPWPELRDFVAPTLTITALGAVESLLCGAVASNMTGVRLQANQELVAQGVGNLLIPFFGGVPATAAIARTSVGIKAGGQTRLVSVIHAVALLASMFVLAPVMARVPLAALAGVLMVTAWRMNEWEAVRFIFGRRLKTAMITFAITMLATIVLDLTQAILIGAFLSGAVFLNQIASLQVEVQAVDPEKLRQRGVEAEGRCAHVRVAYLTGPLFFAATGVFNEALGNLGPTKALILSMRGVPLLDTSGLQVLRALHERLHAEGGQLMISGVHDNVRRMIERGGLADEIGADHFFWSADQAIVRAERLACRHCEAEGAA
jgi:SulP family sulfate permease